MPKTTLAQAQTDLRRRNKIRSTLGSWAMVFPAILFLCVFTLYPMFNLVQISMYRGNAANAYKKYIGLENYRQLLFVRREFLIALKNTAYYTFIHMFLLIALSVIFAVWLQKDRKINNFAQTAFFVPHLVASVSCAFIWSWIFSTDTSGLMNTVLRAFGLPARNWLGSTSTAMNCVIVMNTWKSIGYYALIILSALKAIPAEIYEAARLDSSSTCKTFFKITLPMLSPQLFMLLITITTGSFKVFDSIRIMTNGGPGTSTQVLCMFIYEFAFNRNNSLGMGAAGGVMLMLILILNIKTDDLEINYHRAERELNNMKELLLNGEKAEHIPCKLRTDFQPLFNEAAYCSMVEKAKHYIREGDIFQVVLSNRLEAEMEGSLLDAYRVLRTTNPSPYMFYFSGSDGEIVGASPETLVKLEDGVLHTFPLAGTRPRGATEEADKALEAELLADEKERSEHNMLVDLGRNDIGKISRIGTVEVEKYMSIERYSHVMHIGSTVRGVIREDADTLDAVDAILPAGTLSGAPKLRACEIINELEDNKRGIYGGAIGYISFTGNLDTCIAIRLAFSKNGKVFVRSGAGIVADSVPEKEYRECIQKAAAVKQALWKAQEGMEA